MIPTDAPEAETGDLVLADPRLLSREGRAVYVAHRPSGEWVLGAPGFLDQPAGPEVRTARELLLEDDPSLAEVFDLGVGWHAFRDTPSDPWWSCEIPSGDLFLLNYELRPTELLEARDGIGGAFVNAWVLGASLESARARVHKHLEQTGWAIVRTLGESPVLPGDVPPPAAGHVRRAEIDGEVYVIHAFPPDEPDA